MNEFALPDVGEGLTEAEIIGWRVAVGDTVEVNDVIVEIETAKSLVELPSPYAGVVRTLHAAEGDTVEVGRPIITIGDGAPASGGAAEAPRPESQPHPETERQPMLVGYGPGAEQLVRRRRMAPPSVASVDLEKVKPTRRPLAKPPVRKLAKDLGVDLSEVVATGEVVTRADVEAHAAARQPAEPTPALAPSPTTPDDETRIPIKGVRKWTAEAMVRSAFTAPHVTEWVTVDVSRTMELVARLKGDRAFADVRVSPTLIAAKAICLAMRRTPELNARWDDEAQEIVVKRSVNLGIAAATERGLVVPNVVGADRLSLVDLAAAIGELTATAREGRTQPAQMSGGTFTLTNIGVFGIDAGTPILNPGESGILALGSIERRPWVDDHDQVVPRWVTTLALSFDHRVVDGEQGSRFLADVAAVLRDPAMALTF
ncbi:dihydrolipoamide acetyltransferase family protein [Aeromicrobium endophyticum]|uniref:Dihydrolipoamide acetyltransferase component of pyruvate dehydrogenase complex n=1 Tax=Aeromicrobium endophyticum TaxID=2292704 RepID=A0A371PCN8_9ACTN|nr:dihydrolipoamide acetyltransferase family protein [Aeromicrobium endophyticum]REK73298.1 2-oxo acid dehydrogenase subunit E2 [Aeromicrobium endophyticum]